MEQTTEWLETLKDISMHDFILINALLFGGSFASENSYIDISIGYQPAKFNEPEIHLDSQVVQWEFGKKFKHGKVFYQHSSGLFTEEIGYGFNLVGYKYRIK